MYSSYTVLNISLEMMRGRWDSTKIIKYSNYNLKVITYGLKVITHYNLKVISYNLKIIIYNIKAKWPITT